MALRDMAIGREMPVLEAPETADPSLAPAVLLVVSQLLALTALEIFDLPATSSLVVSGAALVALVVARTGRGRVARLGAVLAVLEPENFPVSVEVRGAVLLEVGPLQTEVTLVLRKGELVLEDLHLDGAQLLLQVGASAHVVDAEARHGLLGELIDLEDVAPELHVDYLLRGVGREPRIVDDVEDLEVGDEGLLRAPDVVLVALELHHVGDEAERLAAGAEIELLPEALAVDFFEIFRLVAASAHVVDAELAHELLHEAVLVPEVELVEREHLEPLRLLELGVRFEEFLHGWGESSLEVEPLVLVALSDEELFALEFLGEYSSLVDVLVELVVEIEGDFQLLLGSGRGLLLGIDEGSFFLDIQNPILDD